MRKRCPRRPSHRLEIKQASMLLDRQNVIPGVAYEAKMLTCVEPRAE